MRRLALDELAKQGQSLMSIFLLSDKMIQGSQQSLQIVSKGRGEQIAKIFSSILREIIPNAPFS